MLDQQNFCKRYDITIIHRLFVFGWTFEAILPAILSLVQKCFFRLLQIFVLFFPALTMDSSWTPSQCPRQSPWDVNSWPCPCPGHADDPQSSGSVWSTSGCYRFSLQMNQKLAPAEQNWCARVLFFIHTPIAREWNAVVCKIRDKIFFTWKRMNSMKAWSIQTPRKSKAISQDTCNPITWAFWDDVFQCNML